MRLYISFTHFVKVASEEFQGLLLHLRTIIFTVIVVVATAAVAPAVIVIE